MNNFQYVTRKQLSPVKKELIQIINSVQNEVRNEFTFQYTFVGSTKYNMVTYNMGTNIGLDFDVNIQVNEKKDKFSEKKIKTIIRKALDRIAPRFGYDYAEDSTRVITIKFKDRQDSKIVHSCDFAIVKVNHTASGEYARVRQLINTGRTAEAETLLDRTAVGDRNAEWHFLKGVLLYRNGWVQDARSEIETACRMDPYNNEYRSFQQRMNSGAAQSPYNTAGLQNNMGCDICDVCSSLMCLNCLCNGGRC